MRRKPHVLGGWRSHIDVGRGNVQSVDRREGYGEPFDGRRRLSGDQHVLPRQRSELPHDQRASKVQGIWWEAQLETWSFAIDQL